MTLWQDIRYGGRVLRQSPGFAVTAVLTIGLGIGVTSAIFSMSDAMLWKPTPLPRIESLAMVLGRVPDSALDWNDISPADFDDIRRENRSFAALAAWTFGAANLVGGSDEPERVA